MIQPRQLNQILNDSVKEFQVQSIFISTNTGQALAQSGLTKTQQSQFSNLSILFDDCTQIGKIKGGDQAQLNYMFVNLEDSQIVISNYKDLFYVGIISMDMTNTGILVQCMKTLRAKFDALH